MTLVEEAVKGLKTEGFSRVTKLEDGNGAIGYIVDREGEHFLLVAKEYSYEGLASFMARLVERAVDESLTLIFYDDAADRYTVFDPDYYQKNGDVSWGESKAEQTRWIELSRRHGVELGDYLAGDEPKTLAGNNSTLGQFA